MAKLNGVFEELKGLTRAAIKSLLEIDIRDLGAIELAKSDSNYELRLSVYQIQFEIRAEMLTNCEETKVGHLRIFRVEKRDGERIEHPFGIFSNDVDKMLGHEFSVCASNDKNLGRIEFVNKNGALESISTIDFGRLIVRYMVSAVADARLPIPLDHL